MNKFYEDLLNYNKKDIYTLSRYYGFTGSYKSLIFQIAKKHATMKARLISVNTEYLFFGKNKNIPREKLKKLPVKKPYVFYDGKYLKLNALKKVSAIVVKKSFGLSAVDTHIKKEHINNLIKSGELEIIQKIEFEKPQIPEHFYTNENAWVALAIDIDKDLVYGIYQGEVEGDTNISSLIKIEPAYQGKGLCQDLAEFTYKSVVNEYNVKKFDIYISPIAIKIPGACRCYHRAAIANGYKVFMEIGDENIELFNEAGCNLLDEPTTITIHVNNEN